jgi:hypothetical protein
MTVIDRRFKHLVGATPDAFEIFDPDQSDACVIF